MKSSKLELALEVFLDRLEHFDKRLDKTENVIPLLEQKMVEIRNQSVKVDASDMKQLLSEWDSVFTKTLKNLLSTSENHVREVEKAVRKHNKSRHDFYIALTVLFGFCLSFLAFGLNEYHKRQDTKEKLSFYQREAVTMHQYLKQKNLIEKYEDWVKNQKAKNENNR